jgi:hypothetical protein
VSNGGSFETAAQSALLAGVMLRGQGRWRVQPGHDVQCRLSALGCRVEHPLTARCCRGRSWAPLPDKQSRAALAAFANLDIDGQNRPWYDGPVGDVLA